MDGWQAILEAKSSPGMAGRVVWRFSAVYGMVDIYEENARAILSGILSGLFFVVLSVVEYLLGVVGF